MKRSIVLLIMLAISFVVGMRVVGQEKSPITVQGNGLNKVWWL